MRSLSIYNLHLIYVIRIDALTEQTQDISCSSNFIGVSLTIYIHNNQVIIAY
jgi:hypothetical protein